MKIALGNNLYAEIDNEDFAKVFGLSFRIQRGRHTNYAVANDNRYLHRIIMNLKVNDPEVDHIDGNGLNCRKGNLRLATGTENQSNTRIKTGTYKGVSWDDSRKKWFAKIRHKGKQYGLGRFDDPIEAAKAYDKKAKELFGEFAKLNFPE